MKWEFHKVLQILKLMHGDEKILNNDFIAALVLAVATLLTALPISFVAVTVME